MTAEQAREPRTEAEEAECDHRDAYGSTIIFDQNRPKDGVCMVCHASFPGHLRVLR